MKPIVWVVLFLFTLPSGAQQVYKWKDDKGRWQFTDTPPPTSGAEKTNIPNRPQRAPEAAPAASGDVTATASAQGATAPGPQDEGTRLKFEGAAREGKVMVGMTRDQVKRALGAPSDTDMRAGANGEAESWRYAKALPGAVSLVTFENGRVIRISTSQEYAREVPAQRPPAAVLAAQEKCDRYKSELSKVDAAQRAGYSVDRGKNLGTERWRLTNEMQAAGCG
jgi:hypothetical protein